MTVGRKLKGIVFSDMHVYPYLRFSHILDDDGMNSRLSEILDVLGRIVLRINSSDIDFAIFAGDMFNEKDKVNVRAFTEAAIMLALIEKPCLMVTGNHDFVAKKGGTVLYSALSIMKELGDNFYLDEEMVVEGQSFIGIPCYEPRGVKKHCEEILKVADPAAILVTHAEVKGAVDGRIQFSTGLPTNLFKKFKMSVVGHIHTPQLDDQIGLLIPGTPLHHDWAALGRHAYIWEMEIIHKQVIVNPIEIIGPRFTEMSAQDFHPEDKEKLHYYRVVGECSEPGDNVECIPFVSDDIGAGRGEVQLIDSQTELLEKWLRFKAISEDDERYASYLAFGKRCLDLT